MVKKANKPLIGYGFWDEKQTINECRNLVRWNPPLAIQYMGYVSGRVATMNSMIIRDYNRSVKYINNFLDILERQRYYNKKEVWGQEISSRLEEIYEPLDEYSLDYKEFQLNENLD